MSRQDASQERRHRVDTLHRQFDRSQASAGWTLPISQQPSFWNPKAPAFTLDASLADEMCRARPSSPPPAPVMDAARRFASKVRHEPNADIRAAFAVERALAELRQGFPFQESAPFCFLNGSAFALDTVTGALKPWRDLAAEDPGDWHGLDQVDLDALGNLVVPWHEVVETGFLRAEWTPQHPRQIFIADVTRPPMEAIALVGTALGLHWSGTALQPNLGDPLESPQADPHQDVLAIGLGHSVAAQALSARLPTARVFNAPLPYDAPAMPNLTWDAVVLGVPSDREWKVAELLAHHQEHPFIEEREILQGPDGTGYGHLHPLLKTAHYHLKPGCIFTLVAAPPQHAVIVESLADEHLTPLVTAGLDTSQRAVWCGYDKKPWSPHGIPAPGGRLLSFWSWR